jgi:hypothetical protein
MMRRPGERRGCSFFHLNNNLGRRQASTVREVEETPGRARFDIQNPVVHLTRIERAGKVAAGTSAGKEDNGRKFHSI